MTWAREVLGLDRYEARTDCRADEIMECLPATMSEVHAKLGGGFTTIWQYMTRMHAMGWVHIAAWVHTNGNGRDNSVRRVRMALYGAGPGRDAPEPPRITTAEMARAWRERKRNGEPLFDELVNARRRARYHADKIVESGRKATPFDALF